MSLSNLLSGGPGMNIQIPTITSYTNILSGGSNFAKTGETKNSAGLCSGPFDCLVDALVATDAYKNNNGIYAECCRSRYARQYPTSSMLSRMYYSNYEFSFDDL